MRPSGYFFKRIYLLLFLPIVITTILVWSVPSPRVSAVSAEKSSGVTNNDIRTDRDREAGQTMERFIAEAGQSPGQIAAEHTDLRGAAENSLSRFKLEINEKLPVPEVISPVSDFLTGPDSEKRPDILRSFLRQNSALLGLDDPQIDRLQTAADYTNPDGNLSFVHLEQKINGIPVFQGEVKAGFTKRGELIRIINNLAPNLDDENLSRDFGDAEQAVANAARAIGIEISDSDTKRLAAQSDDLRVTFDSGQFADQTTAEKFYFPVETGVARAAWRVLLWQKTDAFYVVVDARDGTLLWRKNITQHQTQTATFSVYGNTTSMLKTSDSPTAFTPGCITPLACPQPPIINRQSFILSGAEPPYNFNNLGWITDGTNVTDGNNVEAGLDRDGINGVDAPVMGNPSRVFNFSYNPAPGNPPPGDDPLSAEFQKGSVTNAFYIVNRFHDEMYRLGFTEAARNFQNDNFSRGGVAGDRISAEVQDSSGTNNANFSSGADGTRGRLQLYLWTVSTPRRDSALDAQIIVHELTHGVSTRLHGNGTGLGTAMAGGMGEGWSDFYALAMLSEPTDPQAGTYPLPSYISLGSINDDADYYYGLHRFPTVVRSFVGTNGFPHNPLTFGNLNAGNCSSFNSAFPPRFGLSLNCSEVHNIGEVWTAALWEIRAKFIVRLGWAEGNRRILQFITDGMKFAPLNPTFLQERDAMLAAALAGGTAADSADIWAGFAIRGLGYSAQIISTNPINIVEAFDTPNLTQSPNYTFTEISGNMNGYPENGETILLSIPLTNTTGFNASGVTLEVVGSDTADYGTIPNGQTVTRTVPLTIPLRGPCGSDLQLTFKVNSSLGPVTINRPLRVGTPFGGLTENFDGVTAPALPANWASQQTNTGVNWVTTAAMPDTAPNAVFVPDPATSGGSDLTSPGVTLTTITSGNPVIEFRHKFDTDGGWDGGVLEYSLNSGPYIDVTSNGGYFLSGGYNGPLSGTGNPLAGRTGWTGNSNGYIFTRVQLPSTVLGQNVRFRWRIGHDTVVGGGGWWIDTVRAYGYACGDLFFSKPRVDFDGDGRTDLSVFRPNEGNWYVDRSGLGFMAVHWGIASDQPVPGDFDGDWKTDFAVFRPEADGSFPDFYILSSSTFTYSSYSWGIPGDVPLVGDYNGDGREDIAVYRPSDHTFYVLRSGSGSPLIYPGIPSGVPVTGDFDGDGRTDFATYSVNGWFVSTSLTNYSTINFTQWGAAGDKPVAADYDGDGRTDLAVFRPSDGTWYIQRSILGPLIVQFGLAADIPVPGDYDGDTRADIAVYRSGTWYINRSNSGLLITQFGLNDDLPIPNRLLPQ